MGQNEPRQTSHWHQAVCSDLVVHTRYYTIFNSCLVANRTTAFPSYFRLWRREEERGICIYCMCVCVCVYATRCLSLYCCRLVPFISTNACTGPFWIGHIGNKYIELYNERHYILKRFSWLSMYDVCKFVDCI